MECVIGGTSKYHALFDQPVVGVAAVDVETGQVLEVNRRCAEIFATSVDAMIGSDLAERTEPDDRARLRAALAELGRGEGTGQTRDPVVELACRRLDGQAIRVRITGAAPGVTREVAACVVIIEDVTDRWRAEVQLATYHQLLAESQRIAAIGITERERAMLASRESAARERVALEASLAKTEFLAHMSHELRTPLNAVLGLSEALLERVFGELAADQVNALATIHASGRHLLELINDVLDIARVESGKLPIEPEQVLLRPLIDETAALVHNQLASKNQRLVIELAPVLPPVDIDRRRIKQVLLNLLGNAAKFSTAGATVTLRAAGGSGARQVEIAVSDDGPGIAPADRGRIFEPFVTLDPSMSRAHGGAGLGLTLAKRIVELHGGQIRVDGDVGRGTTFTIALPVSSSYAGEAPAVHRVPTHELVAPAHGSGRTVLLAEDDDATVLTVRSYLESHGYEVRVVRDGVAVLDAAIARDVAVVLLDIQLPGLDGLEVTRRLRAREIGARMPIIALTAHAMSGDEQRCLRAGVSAYMAKPVPLRQLEQMIGRMLEER
jgi:PAS domain S-box-containing protein